MRASSKKSKKSAGRKQSGVARRITRAGGYSHYVTIPKSDIDALGWYDGLVVNVRRVGSKIVIESIK